MITVKKFKLKIYDWTTDKKIPAAAVHVGSPSTLTNPFTALRGKGAVTIRQETLAEVEKFRKYAEVNRVIQSKAKKLKGKDLVCACKVLPCHTEVIMEIANS